MTNRVTNPCISPERLHSSLGYVPPIEFEQSYYAALNRELQPT